MYTCKDECFWVDEYGCQGDMCSSYDEEGECSWHCKWVDFGYDSDAPPSPSNCCLVLSPFFVLFCAN